MHIVQQPLIILRDYSIPMSDQEDWNQFRASLLPITYVISFLYLFGNLNDITNDEDQEAKNLSLLYLWIGIGFMVPGAVIGYVIWNYTDKSEVP